jgi:hypothetical protein
MKDSLVLSLMRYHSEKNEKEYERVALEIAKEFDNINKPRLAEYILAQLYPQNTFLPMTLPKEEV